LFFTLPNLFPFDFEPMNGPIITEHVAQHVLHTDEIFVSLTHKLCAKRFRECLNSRSEDLQKWDARGLLTPDEKDYLELLLVWESRLKHLVVQYYNSCFSL
jgi:hypothetical protein